MTVEIGEILLIENNEIYPPKKKFSVCVCISPNYFFLINSENRAFYKCTPIRRSEHPFLSHDSFISCVRPFLYSEEQIANAKRKGSLSFKELRVLLDFIEQNASFAEKETVIVAIKEYLNT